MRRFVAGLVLLCLCVLSVGAMVMPSFASTTGHGCASPTPPGIPGSPAPAPAASGVVVINEVLTSPHSTWNCSESGVYFTNTDAWIEFYNTQNQPYNLYAAHATLDNGPNTNAYYFPFDASIAAHGYLVVFPNIKLPILSDLPSTLRLVISGVVIDQVTVPTLAADQSYARTSDGASSWAVTSTPTIDASNTSLITPTASGGSLPGTAATTASPAIAFGTQPAWKKLIVPTPPSQPGLAASPAATVPVASQTDSPPSTASPGLDLPRRIILTMLIIALGGALFWGWRVFGSSKKELSPEQTGKQRAQNDQQR